MVVLEFALAVTALSTFSLASTYGEGQYTNSTSPGSSATGGESPTVGIETGTAESAASSTATAHGGGISLGLYPTITVEICGKQCPCGGGHPSYPTYVWSLTFFSPPLLLLSCIPSPFFFFSPFFPFCLDMFRFLLPSPRQSADQVFSVVV